MHNSLVLHKQRERLKIKLRINIWRETLFIFGHIAWIWLYFLVGTAWTGVWGRVPQCARALARPRPELAGYPLKKEGRGGVSRLRHVAPPSQFKFTFSMGPGCRAIEQFVKGDTPQPARSDLETHWWGPNHFVAWNIKQLEKSCRFLLSGRCVYVRARAGTSCLFFSLSLAGLCFPPSQTHTHQQKRHVLTVCPSLLAEAAAFGG